MKPRQIMECVYYNNCKCTRFGYNIDDCNPNNCEVADFVYTFIRADSDFEPFVDELNRRLDKGV